MASSQCFSAILMAQSAKALALGSDLRAYSGSLVPAGCEAVRDNISLNKLISRVVRSPS